MQKFLNRNQEDNDTEKKSDIQILNLENETVEPLNQHAENSHHEQSQQSQLQQQNFPESEFRLSTSAQSKVISVKQSQQQSLISPNTADSHQYANLVSPNEDRHSPKLILLNKDEIQKNQNSEQKQVQEEQQGVVKKSNTFADMLKRGKSQASSSNLNKDQQGGFMNAISQSIADTMHNMYLKEQANPAPLGLIGFGMTTLLLNIHNVGAYPTSAMICGMGIFVGGIAQIIAGIFEFLKNNTFGQTAFIGYGCFWLSLVTIWVFPALPNKANTIAPNEIAMGWYLFAWGLYTSIMFFGTLKLNRLLQVVFFTLVLCFFMLAIGKWADNLNCIKAAGWIGIICGSSAMYGAVAQVINEIYGKTIMPLGQMKKVTKVQQLKKH